MLAISSQCLTLITTVNPNYYFERLTQLTHDSSTHLTHKIFSPFCIFGLLFRFVQDVPLAFTKTSNYYNAISMALKLLTDIKNNRDTHVSIT